jgi:hypothetical protein
MTETRHHPKLNATNNWLEARRIPQSEGLIPATAYYTLCGGAVSLHQIYSDEFVTCVSCKLLALQQMADKV